MLRFIFRKNKSNKERLWSSPKDAPVLQSHKPLLEDESKPEGSGDPEGAPPSPPGSDPSYSSIAEAVSGQGTSALPGAADPGFHQPFCSTFFPPEAPETGEAIGGVTDDLSKRTSIVFVETDAVPTLDPDALYAAVQKPRRSDRPLISDGTPTHGLSTITDYNKNSELARTTPDLMEPKETHNMSETPPVGDKDAGKSDRRPESGFDFTISLMEELLADFKTFEDLPFPDLEDLTPDPSPPKEKTLFPEADDFRMSDILREPSPEIPTDLTGDVEVNTGDSYNDKIGIPPPPPLPPPGTNAVINNPERQDNPPATLRKTVTFNDDVQKFERPQSLVTESDAGADDTIVKLAIMEEPEITECPVPADDNKEPDGDQPGDFAVSYNQNGCVVSRVRQPLPPDNTSLDLSVASDDDVYSDEERESLKKPIVVRKFRGLRITLLIFAWVLMGLSCEVSDPALRYYSEGLNDTYEEISRGYAAEGGGLALGALLTGLVASHNQGYPDVTIVASMLVAAASLVSRPWARSLLYFCLNLASMGIARGMLLVGGTVYGARIQEETKCTVLMYLLFTFYNLGALSSCQLFFIITNIQIPDKIHAFLKLISYPPGSWGEEGVAGEEGYRATPVFPWNPAGVLLGLIVGMGCFLLAVSFLALLVYSVSRRRKARRRERERARKERDRFKRGIRMLGPAGSPEMPHPEKGSSGRSPLLGRDRMEDKEDSGSETDFGFIKPKDKEASITHKNAANGTVGNGDVTHSVTNPAPNGILTKKATVDLEASYSSSQMSEKFNNRQKRRKRKGKMVSFNVKHKDERVSWFMGDQALDVPLLMYMYVFFSLAAGSEFVMGRYLYEVILTADMEIGQKEATCIMIAYWGASSVSRMMSLPVSRGLTPNAIMITCLTLSIVGPIILGLYGSRFHIILWLFTAITGFAYGPILSGGLTFANIYLNLVPKTIALVFILAGLGVALFGWLGGLILDYFGCKALMYYATGIGCLSALLYIPVLITLATKKLFKVTTPKSEEKMVTRKPAITYL